MDLRVLVIEDEPELVEFLVQGLTEEGCSVEHLADGEEALQALRTHPWDLALLDWQLPTLSGLEVLKELRAHNNRPPVLFLTARDSVADRVTGLDAGADDYLCKPFAFDELLARIRALTRRLGSTETEVLTFQDVSLNLRARLAARGSRRLSLTAKEEALLAYFIRHPQVVLTRDRIFEDVWLDQYDPRSNTIEVHIVSLRAKLESGGRGRLIHTVRHRGYLFGDLP